MKIYLFITAFFITLSVKSQHEDMMILRTKTEYEVLILERKILRNKQSINNLINEIDKFKKLDIKLSIEARKWIGYFRAYKKGYIEFTGKSGFSNKEKENCKIGGFYNNDYCWLDRLDNHSKKRIQQYPKNVRYKAKFKIGKVTYTRWIFTASYKQNFNFKKEYNNSIEALEFVRNDINLYDLKKVLTPSIDLKYINWRGNMDFIRFKEKIIKLDGVPKELLNDKEDMRNYLRKRLKNVILKDVAKLNRTTKERLVSRQIIADYKNSFKRYFTPIYIARRELSDLSASLRRHEKENKAYIIKKQELISLKNIEDEVKKLESFVKTFKDKGYWNYPSIDVITKSEASRNPASHLKTIVVMSAAVGTSIDLINNYNDIKDGTLKSNIQTLINDAKWVADKAFGGYDIGLLREEGLDDIADMAEILNEVNYYKEIYPNQNITTQNLDKIKKEFEDEVKARTIYQSDGKSRESNGKGKPNGQTRTFPSKPAHIRPDILSLDKEF